MSVFRGSSGSPIFIEKQDMVPGKGKLTFRTAFCLAGIVSDAIIQTKDHEVEVIKIPTTEKMIYKTEQFLDLGVVIKAERISELLYLTRIK